MRFNENGTIYKVTTVTTQFIGLNLLYLITCLPVITIGAATTALFDVTMHYADGEKGYLIKDYLISLKRNWRQSTRIFLLILLPILLLGFSGFFWFAFKNILGTVAGMIAMALIAVLLSTFMIASALVARYENSTKQTLQNALLLTIAHPLKALCILLIPVTVGCLAILTPSLKFLLLLLGFSFSAYSGAFLLLNIFSNHK
ncbi:YesL family protein [Candidatus Enterococcus leclercqii]|uniref:YesL family protein n=1 Tax=Candidatus Enterococcus leclercqii TaxID=1857218 RepID=UPI00137A403D|nr:YesL family protein [Enterococcus sp. CU9D]KAF1290782.1 hypothetical protein BAU14_08380 [Enterococcus sp. CU9D]